MGAAWSNEEMAMMIVYLKDADYHQDGFGGQCDRVEHSRRPGWLLVYNASRISYTLLM